MNSLQLALILIVSLFIIFLILKQLLKGKIKEEFCVLCVSVSVTWILLLVLFWLGKFEDKILIALLMGQSTLGVFYLLDHKINDNLKIFRLPFLLTLIVAAYSLINNLKSLIYVIILAFLWALFGIIYLYRSNVKVNGLVKRLIECCKNF